MKLKSYYIENNGYEAKKFYRCPCGKWIIEELLDILPEFEIQAHIYYALNVQKTKKLNSRENFLGL